MLKNLKVLLAKREMTQKELSRLTGISLATIGLYAAGKGNPTVRNVRAIWKALGCEIEDLFGQPLPLSGGPSISYTDDAGIPHTMTLSDPRLRDVTTKDFAILKAYRKLTDFDRDKVDALLFRALISQDSDVPLFRRTVKAPKSSSEDGLIEAEDSDKE